MSVRERLSAKAANTSNSIKNFFATEQSTVKATNDVLREEYAAIWGGDAPQDEAAYRREMEQKGQAALCLSGGGIRSAAFSLGVLQILASRRLLTQFHYLSTVSGGGYIGGWLSRWIAEAKDQDATNIEAELARPAEILQVSNLRANSNFLTPKVGITSADTWTGILLWVRNVLLNWTVFIPALLFAVLAPNVYLALMTYFAVLARAPAKWFGFHPVAVVLLGIASVSLLFGTWETIRNLPSHRADGDPSSSSIRWRIVVPLLLWAGLVPLVLAAGRYNGNPDLAFGESILFWLLVSSFVAKIAAYLFAWITDKEHSRLYLRNILTWVIVVVIATGALWLALMIVDGLSTLLPATADLLKSAGADLRNAGTVSVATIVFALAIFGPLAGTLAHLLLSTLYVGFRSTDFQDDADREWLARVGAVVVFPALLWTIFALICLFLPFVFIDNSWLRDLLPAWGPSIEGWAKALGAISGVISGLVAVLGGKSGAVRLDISNAAPKTGSTKAHEWAVRLTTLLFIAFLFTVLAYVERVTAERLSAVLPSSDWNAIAHFIIPRMLVFLALYVPIYLFFYARTGRTLVLILAVVMFLTSSTIGLTGERILMAQSLIAAVLFLIISTTSKKIDVNRFSMHGVYRNRLVRAFLGGARAGRMEDPFTHFDAADNYRVSELKAQKDKRRVLYPVVNVTLNLVGGENLAWQERKASSFIITPLYCGSAALGDPVPNASANDPRRSIGAYVKTEDYGGSEPDLNDDKTGISLGTAMTISGAAVSPSMGYNSAPGTAFLMTLFNVRLGAWLTNPAAKIAKNVVKGGPTSALKPLVTEALGLTDAKSDNVYLSDGGHFDNLGIYEMIRRRCRYILVVDADADERFAFEDLARSVRFSAIDLDAKIEFESIKMKSRLETKEDSVTFAVGKITYAESPSPGWLIYLKPTYFYETAPVDVRSYGAVNPTFPHQATLDQWFSESQFESYRRLGEYLMCKLCDLPRTKPSTLADFFTAVRSTSPPAPSIQPDTKISLAR